LMPYHFQATSGASVHHPSRCSPSFNHRSVCCVAASQIARHHV
jgi:hypothetical protein